MILPHVWTVLLRFVKTCQDLLGRARTGQDLLGLIRTCQDFFSGSTDLYFFLSQGFENKAKKLGQKKPTSTLEPRLFAVELLKLFPERSKIRRLRSREVLGVPINQFYQISWIHEVLKKSLDKKTYKVLTSSVLFAVTNSSTQARKQQ